MARTILQRRTIVVILSLLVLASGTPQVLARDAAQDAHVTQAVAARQERTTATPVQSSGVPPDDEPYRAMTLPTASDANPPYPTNHTLDAIPPEIVGTPPANHGVESPGYAVGLPPSNHDLEAAAQPTGTPPANHDFATGDLSGWTTTGTVTIQSDATHGSYAQLNSGATLTTSAFTIDASSQTIAVEIGFRSASGIDRVKLAVLSGTGYTTVTEIGDVNCSGCASWVTRSMNASPWLGQSVKLRISAVAGLTGIDSARTEVSFPGYTLSGTVSPTVETSGNTFARLEKNGVLTTAAFTVDSSAQFLAIKTLDQSAQGGQFFLYVLSGPSYATETKVHTNTNVPDTWTKISVNTSQWQGQSIKLQVRWQAAAFGVDDLGTQSVEIPDWQVESDAWLEPTTQAGDTGYVVSTNGDLTSQPFTIDASAQHLTLDYQSVINSIFYVKLLRGATFDQVVDLHGGSISGTASWQTLKLGIQLYAGETVKLTIEQYWGRGRYDNLGRQELVLPDWELATTQAVTTGEDAHGSWVQAFDRSAAYLLSGEIATGIIDGVGSDQRYYAIAYDIGYTSGEMVRITWHDRATGQSWVVFTDAQNSPTGYRTRYFWLADFMGTDGYFEVQIPDVGKVYSIADNIARQHLAEPFSNKIGTTIDTSTGSFGYEVQDLAAEGTLPLVFTRYYAGHADHRGTLGYRWSHTYDTRLVIDASGDAGVIYGSGKAEFYDWQSLAGEFVGADARIHNTLVKNGDGSYTFTTTANLTYQFTATGVLSSIADLNGNATTLTYDTNGRLTTVADPVGRTLTLTYDPNGRLATVTDPVGAVVTYGYDATGDLTTVTDPELDIWTYAYDAHRLVSVTDPDNHPLFSNTFDSQHRVIAQTDAQGNPITIDYATPAKGVTSATDREGNSAQFYFDRYGRTTEMVDPLGRTISRFFDAEGNLERVIDPAFNEWQFGYNGSGDLTDAVDPLGNPVSITYNATHLPTTVTDGRGFVTTYAYDANSNVTSVTNALNETTSYTYDSAGRRLTITNPLNETVTYTYDTQGNRISMSDALGNTWQATYNAAGRLLTLTDPRNFTTSYEYDPFGRVTLIRDPLGGETHRVFDWWGYILVYQDPLGRQTSWTYDEKGRVASKLDAEQHATTYGWDDNNNLISATDSLGHATTYAYDANGRLTSVTDASGGVTSYAYDLAGRLASETDPLGRSATYSYNAAGLLTSQILSNGGVLTYTYDDNGNLLTETNPLNQTTTYAYDVVNRLTSVTDPHGHTWSSVYDAAGRLIEEHDALNQVTERAYDVAGQLISITDPLNAVTTFGYDAARNQISVTDPLGHASTSTYDALNRLISTTNALSQTTTFAYDAASQRTSVTAPSGVTTTSAYDDRGLLTSVTDPLNNVVQYAYDDIGRRISTTDQRGHMTTYAYEAQARATTVTDPLNGQLRFEYDAAGQLTAFTNARGKTTSYTYTSLSQISSVTDPLNRLTTYGYDTLGRLTSVTDPRGLTTGYSYDVGGNLTSESYAGGTIAYGYDALHRRTSMTDATGVTNWSYDAASRVTAVTSATGTVGYGYDAASRRTSMTYPGNRTVSYGYDDANRVTSLTDWQSQTFTFAYNVDGRRTGITRPNGVSTTYGYDAANRLTSVVHGGGGLGSNLSFSYTLDAAGNRTAVTGSRGTETYAIDALNRITSASYPNGDTVAYTYDANGNRLTDALNGQTLHTYTYDDADQLTSDGSRTFTYDAAGNALTAGSEAFTWDWRNRLVSATVSGTTASYAYDGDDVRVSQTASGTTTTYLWDRASGLPLLLDDGTQAYIHAGGIQSMTASSGTTLYPLADGLGSIRATTDGSGAATTTADYGVFGDVRATSGSPGSFGFSGEQTDAATDLTYLRARYYDAEIGRFLSADTIQPNAPGTQGYNRYAYVANNPTTWTDPSGHTVGEQGGLNDNANKTARGLAALVLFISFVFYYIGQCLSGVLPQCQGEDLFPSSFSPPTVAPPGGWDRVVPSEWDWQGWQKLVPPITIPEIPGLPGPGGDPDGDPDPSTSRPPFLIPGLPPSLWPFPPPWEWFDPAPNPTPGPTAPAQPAPTPGGQPGATPAPQPGPSPQPTSPPGGTATPTPTPEHNSCAQAASKAVGRPLPGHVEQRHGPSARRTGANGIFFGGFWENRHANVGLALSAPNKTVLPGRWDLSAPCLITYGPYADHPNGIGLETDSRTVTHTIAIPIDYDGFIYTYYPCNQVRPGVTGAGTCRLR